MAVDSDPGRAHAIRRLFRLGMGIEEATAAVDGDRITLSLVDHLLGGPRVHTRDEAAARAGLDPEVAAVLERVSGVADGTRYSEAEIRHLSLIGRLLQFVPDEMVLDQIRGDVPVLRTMALRTLDTAEEVFLRAAREEVDDPIDLAIRLVEVAGPLLEVSAELVGQSYRRVILHLLTSDLIVQALRDDAETIPLAVGFVDVVGYTSLAARVDPTGLDDLLSAFEHLCQATVEGIPEVQLVKFLGDAAMFVSLDPVALGRALYVLTTPIEDEDAPLAYAPIKGGMASGEALFRGGDYYGAPVNEAARLTDLARRNSVLASDELHDVLDGHFKLRRIRPVRLHGIGLRRPYALREVLDAEAVEG